MSLILAFALLAQSGNLEAPSQLAEHDWFVIQRDAQGYISAYKCLSLQKGTKWASGVAWYLDFDASRDESLFACRGKYTFDSSKLNEGTLVLALAFPRRYKGVINKDHSCQWTIDRRYEAEPTGVMVEIPLTGAQVETDPLTVVVAQGFWTDDDGGAHSNPKDATLGDLFRGRDEVRRTRHLELGQTLAFQAVANATFLQKPLPPGFALHHHASASGDGADTNRRKAATALIAALGRAAQGQEV